MKEIKKMMLNPKVDVEHRKTVCCKSCRWATILILSHIWKNFHCKKKSQAPEMATKLQRKLTWRWKLNCWPLSQKLKR